MKSHKILLAVGVLIILAWAVSPTLAAPSQKALAPNLEWVQETFIDYTHAGPGPHPTTESSSFHLTQGGISWFSGGTVEYQITGTEGITGGNTAIENAKTTWDGFVTTRAFTRNDSTTQTNPCTGNPNTIQWSTIDGVGGALATASVCRNVATKAIGGFVMTLDSAEPWATDGNLSSFDVENVASHEWGHIVGLGHTNAPKDGCLATYRFTGLGEIQKRTLGLGDKLGMNNLYGSTDTSAGSCGS